MKRLLVWRHAKTERENRDGDKARALTARGRADTVLIATLMRENGWLPDRVLCSTAVRAVQTLETAMPVLGEVPAVAYLNALYLAPWKQVLNLLRTVPDSAETLLAIGHHPGFEDLALALARPPQSPEEKSYLDNIGEKFPTAAVAVLDFEIADWDAIVPGTGALAAFVAPRFLKDG